MWQQLSKIIKMQSVPVRVTFKDGNKTNWSNWLIFPTEQYGEVSMFGPFRLIDVKNIELDPLIIKNVGRLLPKKKLI